MKIKAWMFGYCILSVLKIEIFRNKLSIGNLNVLKEKANMN
jgi:hypothetical protein